MHVALTPYDMFKKAPAQDLVNFRKISLPIYLMVEFENTNINGF